MDELKNPIEKYATVNLHHLPKDRDETYENKKYLRPPPSSCFQTPPRTMNECPLFKGRNHFRRKFSSSSNLQFSGEIRSFSAGYSQIASRLFWDDHPTC